MCSLFLRPEGTRAEYSFITLILMAEQSADDVPDLQGRRHLLISRPLNAKEVEDRGLPQITVNYVDESADTFHEEHVQPSPCETQEHPGFPAGQPASRAASQDNLNLCDSSPVQFEEVECRVWHGHASDRVHFSTETSEKHVERSRPVPASNSIPKKSSLSSSTGRRKSISCPQLIDVLLAQDGLAEDVAKVEDDFPFDNDSQAEAGDVTQARLVEIMTKLNTISAELALLVNKQELGHTSFLSPTPKQLGSSSWQQQPELRGDQSAVDCSHGRQPKKYNPETPTFESQRSKQDHLRLNVGGHVFEVTWDLLKKIPSSRLGRLAQCRSLNQALSVCDNYDPWRNEFYFNHRYRNFADILSYYRTNSLHISDDCCAIGFVQDLNYWGLSESCLEACCLKKYVDSKEQLDWDIPDPSALQGKVEVFPEGKLGKIQKKLWDLFEHPHTSMSARIVGIISLACIFISTVILTLETLPYFQDSEDQILGEFSVFAVIEAVYMCWFTLEFLVRLFSCPSKFDFIKKTMNWIDLLAIIPYYVTVVLHSYGMTGVTEGEQGTVELTSAGEDAGTGDVSRTTQYFRLLKIARIVKTLRIIRIFKLARHSTGLQALGNTMRANYKELGLLFLLLGMGAIMFASLIYVFEKEDNESTFKTMFHAYWWAIITMTTVGYGDVSPVTGIGKVIGCFCAIFGVLVIGLPIPIIGNSFNRFYARQKRWEKREALASQPNRWIGLESMSIRRKTFKRRGTSFKSSRSSSKSSNLDSLATPEISRKLSDGPDPPKEEV